MRISDWSSDVCSSDLLHTDAHRTGVAMALAHHDAAHRHERKRADAIFLRAQDRGDDDIAPGLEPAIRTQLDPMAQAIEGQHLIRSEEHTSELQSLMRISYAVCCLKNKKSKQTRTILTQS